MDSIALPLLSSALICLATLLGAFSLPRVWDRITHRYVADLLPIYRDLGYDEANIPTYLRWWGLAMFSTAIFLVVFQALPLAIPALGLLYVAPRLWLNWLIKRRQILIRDQLVGATVALSNTARAGMSIAQGFESICGDTPEPLSGEMRRIVGDVRGGLPLSDAITTAKNRLQVDSFTLFAASVLTCLERGGKLTQALERISMSLQENQRVERKLEANTASGRKVVRILAVFPVLFLGLFFVIYPEGTTMLFTSLPGQIVFMLVILLVIAGIRWASKIMALDI